MEVNTNKKASYKLAFLLRQTSRSIETLITNIMIYSPSLFYDINIYNESQYIFYFIWFIICGGCRSGAGMFVVCFVNIADWF